MTLSFTYIFIIYILFLVSFKLYEQDQKIVNWKDVDKTSQYASLEISEMSEAFAEIKGENKTVHFVIEKEATGEWHTYLIAIKKEDYEKYKKIIDHTYERIEEIVEPIKIYGYPVLISDDIKNLAIKNIGNFVPIENKIVLDNKNFEEYMTNTYLDTTKEKTHQFNYIILILLIMALILIILLIFTIFDKDKIVDEVDEIIEKEEKKLKKKKKAQKSKIKSQEKKNTNKKSKTNKEKNPVEKSTKKEIQRKTSKETNEKEKNKTKREKDITKSKVENKNQKVEEKGNKRKKKESTEDIEIL